MINIERNSFEESLTLMKKITRMKALKSSEIYDFIPFRVANHNSKIAAVDGSNHNIKGVNFIISALRAGYLVYQNKNLIEKNITPVMMEMLINTPDKEEGYWGRYKKHFQALTKEIPNDMLEFEKAPERIRTILEWKAINDLVDCLSHGDVIIFDGSLISGVISTNHYFYDNLITKARNNGISLVGLSKDTSLSIGNVPITMVLKDAAKKQVGNKNWYVKLKENQIDIDLDSEKQVQLQNTYFVKFTEQKDLIFRFDVVKPDDILLEEILSKVGAYTFSKRTFGYPYPMQKIHDAVRISDMEKQYSFSVLKNAWLKEKNPKTDEEAKAALREFEDLFFNYHNQLDIISFGR